MSNKRVIAPVILSPVKMPFVQLGEPLNEILMGALKRSRISLRGGDILAIASKVVSVAERRIVNLDKIEVTLKAKRLATKWRMGEKLAALVLDEADTVIGGVPGFLLTLKDGILTANAGVDLKNTPRGSAVRWPEKPDKSAAGVRRFLESKFAGRIGVIIVDSRVTPLRLGTVGLAIGMSGIVPVRDDRGIMDLYGRKTRVTQENIVDDVASAAHLLMGETSERIGAVAVRNAPALLDRHASSRGAKISVKQCLIASNLKPPLSSSS